MFDLWLRSHVHEFVIEYLVSVLPSLISLREVVEGHEFGVIVAVTKFKGSIDDDID